MITLVIFNEKGGVGKTTIVNQLAFYFRYLENKKVLVIDTDTQGNTTYCQEKHGESIAMPGVQASTLFKQKITTPQIKLDNPSIFYLPGDGALADIDRHDQPSTARTYNQNLKTIGSLGFEYCIVDTAASIGTKLTSTLLSTDYVLAPVELEIFSVKGIKDLYKLVHHVQTRNTKLKFLGMVPNKVDRRNPLTDRNLKILQSTYPSLTIPFEIGARTSIGVATATGQPIWNIKKTTARQASKEIKSLGAYIFEQMKSGEK